MSTRRNRFVLITLRIGFFVLPVILPMRCMHEVVEGFSDFLSLFRWCSKKARGHLRIVESALLLIKDHGPLDLANVDVKSPDARVKIKILTR